MVLRLGGWLGLGLQLPTDSISEGDAAGGGDPVLGSLAVPAAGPLAADRFDVEGGGAAGVGDPARDVPAGPLPAAGPRAAAELDVQDGLYR
ncbi:hypothetical protein D3C85_365680 [compost metagenome]